MAIIPKLVGITERSDVKPPLSTPATSFFHIKIFLNVTISSISTKLLCWCHFNFVQMGMIRVTTLFLIINEDDIVVVFCLLKLIESDFFRVSKSEQFAEVGFEFGFEVPSAKVKGPPWPWHRAITPWTDRLMMG